MAREQTHRHDVNPLAARLGEKGHLEIELGGAREEHLGLVFLVPRAAVREAQGPLRLLAQPLPLEPPRGQVPRGHRAASGGKRDQGIHERAAQRRRLGVLAGGIVADGEAQPRTAARDGFQRRREQDIQATR